MSESEMSRNKIMVAQCVHDLFRVWSRVRIVDGQPVSILQMLTTDNMRESFIRSCYETLGLMTDGDGMRSRILHNFILQELVRHQRLVFEEDIS